MYIPVPLGDSSRNSSCTSGLWVLEVCECDVQQTAGSPSRPCFGSSYDKVGEDVSLAVIRRKSLQWVYTHMTYSLIRSSYCYTCSKSNCFISPQGCVPHFGLTKECSIKTHFPLNTIYISDVTSVWSHWWITSRDNNLCAIYSPFTGYHLIHRGMIYQLFVSDKRPAHFDKMEDWAFGLLQISPTSVFVLPALPCEC